MAYCKKCGAPLGQNDTFCGSCGQPVTPSANQGFTGPPPPSSQPQQNLASQANYCQDCGSLVPYGTLYCPSCGSNKLGPHPPQRLTRPTGVLVLGIVQIIFALIDLVIGLVAGGFLFTAGGVAGGAIGGLLAVLGIVFVVSGILSTVFAIAFLTGRNWGRILMMIGAVLELFAIPIGTIIGIIVLWYLTRPRVRAYFKQPKGRKGTQGIPMNPP